MPLVLMRAAGTPRLIKKSRAALARLSESGLLMASDPVLSVCPMMDTCAYGFCSEVCAKRSSTGYILRFSTAEPTANDASAGMLMRKRLSVVCETCTGVPCAACSIAIFCCCICCDHTYPAPAPKAAPAAAPINVLFESRPTAWPMPAPTKAPSPAPMPVLCPVLMFCICGDAQPATRALAAATIVSVVKLFFISTLLAFQPGCKSLYASGTHGPCTCRQTAVSRRFALCPTNL